MSGADLSYSDLTLVYFGDTVLKDADFTKANLHEVDLSLALNKDLSGTILVNVGVAHSNLVGVDLSGKDLSSVNFYSADLTGQDFTNNVIFYATNFHDAKLSNANFEGVDLFSDTWASRVLKDKAHLKNLSNIELISELFGEDALVRIMSTQISGDDLEINYIYYTNFNFANLENANFKNANLQYATFFQADLTNADLSGTDLRDGFLEKADLSNANLQGANLQGAILHNAILSNANLKCINHPICESD